MSGTWWEYVQKVSRRALQKELAAATGIEQSNFSRWKKGKTKPSGDHVVTFARAYNRPPVEAFIEAGYLNADEVAGIVKLEASIHDLPTADLLDELQHRYRVLRGTPERGRRRSDKTSVSNTVEPTLKERAAKHGDEDSTGGLGAVGRG